MTTIRDKMPGRPPVEPYLHGVSEWEPPQTQVAWREEVEIIVGDLLDRYAPADLLDDSPLKPHELLRDRSDRVFKHLATIAGRHPGKPAWLIDDRGSVEVLVLQKLADKNNKDRIKGCTVLLPPNVGGLSGGLLNGKTEYAQEVHHDVADQWYEDKEQTEQRRSRFRTNTMSPEEIGLGKMSLIRSIDKKPDADEVGPPEGDEETGSSASGRFWHWYVKPGDADNATRASAASITWDHHTRDVVTRIKNIVKALELPDNLQQALIVAAELHDLGKKREQWQRSIGNPNPTDWYAKPGKPADGPRWRPRRLSPYRHEFGSLLDVLDVDQKHFARFERLDDEMQDLVLYLIAAHHGRARPHFPVNEDYDPKPGHDALAREQATETPRRFARLQRRYGRVHTIRDGDYRVTVELPPDSKTDKSDSKNDQRPGYNIDRFPDGTNICEIDSPQSQSNRIEPKFKTIKDGKLVPQIEIAVGSEKVNLLDVGHRAADAVVRMSSMAEEFHGAFIAAKSGNFFELAKYAPTSLVFGVWDSRSTYVKVQRALKAQIRATNVLELSRSAQYTPATDYIRVGAIGEDTESGKKEEDNNLSQEGMKHALSTQTVGGVKLTENSTLMRTVNLNLAAIRVLKGGTEEETKTLQRYILGLALVAAMDEPDLNLREGCNLRYDDSEDAKKTTKRVYRNKPPEGQSCDFDEDINAIQSFAEEVAKSFFEVANIESDRIDHPNVIFETGVAEAYLSRTKSDRKKIARLGPITKNTMTSFDVQSKDPFKPVMKLLKDVKRAIGRKPAKFEVDPNRWTANKVV